MRRRRRIKKRRRKRGGENKGEGGILKQDLNIKQELKLLRHPQFPPSVPQTSL